MTKTDFENLLYILAVDGLSMNVKAFISLRAHMALPELAKFLASELWINMYPECFETQALRQQLLNLADEGIFIFDQET